MLPQKPNRHLFEQTLTISKLNTVSKTQWRDWKNSVLNNPDDLLKCNTLRGNDGTGTGDLATHHFVSIHPLALMISTWWPLSHLTEGMTFLIEQNCLGKNPEVSLGMDWIFSHKNPIKYIYSPSKAGNHPNILPWTALDKWVDQFRTEKDERDTAGIWDFLLARPEFSKILDEEPIEKESLDLIEKLVDSEISLDGLSYSLYYNILQNNYRDFNFKPTDPISKISPTLVILIEKATAHHSKMRGEFILEMNGFLEKMKNPIFKSIMGEYVDVLQLEYNTPKTSKIKAKTHL